jgi:hypothetical protein
VSQFGFGGTGILAGMPACAGFLHRQECPIALTLPFGKEETGIFSRVIP